jgi:hypothetical protein
LISSALKISFKPALPTNNDRMSSFSHPEKQSVNAGGDGRV